MSVPQFVFAPEFLAKECKEPYAAKFQEREKFNEWIKKLKEETVGRVTVEFDSLAAELDNQTIPITIYKENAEFNRYVDIVCFDSTRVVLEDGLNPNYIHANWIDGYERPRAYILTQGPMDNTVFDFWRLVWQERIVTVVMVTRLEEKGRQKCARYFPTTSNGPFRSGFFEIALKGLEKTNCCLTSLLAVKNTLNNEVKMVAHVWFSLWPDQGVPEDIDSIRIFTNYIKLVNLNMSKRFYSSERQHKRGPPVLYHCSAGIGRSGTLVILDYLTEAMSHGSHTDILQLVRKMRKERHHIVQTKIQLLFIYSYVVTLANLNKHHYLR